MVKLFANHENPDQTPRSAVSDLGLHCLPITLLGVSLLQWVKITKVENRKWTGVRSNWKEDAGINSHKSGVGNYKLKTKR